MKFEIRRNRKDDIDVLQFELEPKSNIWKHWKGIAAIVALSSLLTLLLIFGFCQHKGLDVSIITDRSTTVSVRNANEQAKKDNHTSADGTAAAFNQPTTGIEGKD